MLLDKKPKNIQELSNNRLLHGRLASKCASTSFSLRVEDLAMLDYICGETGLSYSEMVRRVIRVKYLQLSTSSSENTE